MWEYRQTSFGLLVAVGVMAAIGIILTTLCFIFNVRYRKLRVVRMSSPNLNTLITLGCFLSYSCCVLFGLDSILGKDLSASTSICQVRTWVLTLSVTLVFGTILAKSWRVHRIFRKAGTQRVVIKDEKLVAIVIVLICIDVIILSLWHGLDPLKAQVMPGGFWKYETAGVSNWTAVAILCCTCEKVSIWLTTIFIYKAVLLIAGVYLAWATRNVLLPSMNEAKFTILAALTTTIIGSLAAALSVVFQSLPNLASGILASAVWISTTFCLLLVFAPKMRLVFGRKEVQIVRHSMRMTSSSDFSQNDVPEQLKDDVLKLMSENQLLKKSLSEKDGAIQSLQDHLDSAQTKLEQLTEEAEIKNDSGLDFEVSSATSSQGEEPHNRTILVRPADERNATTNDCLTMVSEQETISPRTKPKRSESLNTSRPILDRTIRGDSRPGSLRSDREGTRSRLVALRDSIAEDLQHAHSFSTNLRDSIFKELDQLSFNETSPAVLLCAGSRKGLVGSIAESYNFDQDADDWSYIHQFLKVQTPSYRKAQHEFENYGKPNRNSTSEIPDCQIASGSEKLYPEFQVKDHRRPKRSKSQRRSREVQRASKYIAQSGRRSKLYDNVYVIQNPAAKEMITNCVVQKQCMQTADGTVCFEVLDSFV